MTYSYPALFVKQEEGYAIVFVDLALGIAYGENKEDALDVAFDELASMLLEEDTYPKDKLPNPSAIENIDAKKTIEEIFHQSVGTDDYFIENIEIDSVDLKDYSESN